MAKVPSCFFWVLVVQDIDAQAKTANVRSLEVDGGGPVGERRMKLGDSMQSRLHGVLFTGRRRIGAKTTYLFLDPVLCGTNASIDSVKVRSR